MSEPHDKLGELRKLGAGAARMSCYPFSEQQLAILADALLVYAAHSELRNAQAIKLYAIDDKAVHEYLKRIGIACVMSGMAITPRPPEGGGT